MGRKYLENHVGIFYANAFREIKKYHIEHGWSISSIRKQLDRFIEGGVKDNLLSRSIKLHELHHNRQSKEYFITQYGEEIGSEKFKKLQERQAYTNSKEYKGMNDEEFKNYNKSRSVTLENLIKRHGEEIGNKKWWEYIKKQKYTKSRNYYIDLFGEEIGNKKYDELISKKVQTKENFIKRYGVEEGLKRFEIFRKKRKIFHSQLATKCFNMLDEMLNEFKIKTIFAPKDTEFSLFDYNLKRWYFYDFVIPDLNYCIEFNGDVFHGNPKFFSQNDKPNPFSNLTSKEIWENDKQKIELIKQNGFFVDIIWESDFKNSGIDIIKKIVNNIKTGRISEGIC